MDFGGQRAAEILFERTGMSGNSCESIPAWKTFTRTSGAGIAGYDRVVESGNSVTGDAESEGAGRSGGKGTGRVLESDHRETTTRCTEPAAYTLKIRSGCEGGGKGALVQTEKSTTLSTLQDQTVFQPVVYDARGNGDGKIVPTITGDHENRITDYTAITLMGQPVVGTLLARDYKGVGLADSLSKCVVERKPNELQKTVHYTIRRLTPVECERLQGFPDGYTDIGDWTDGKGKKHKYADSPRYKALGNSIALPQWFWLVQKMRPYLKEKPTLGSLFDGLGGFPLVWQTAYGEGTARWASEIEEFPMAVTKRRFGEE